MRWSGQELGEEQQNALPGLARLNNLVRSVRTPEFAGITFHEVLAKSALNKVPGTGKNANKSKASALPFGWTINPYRGCSHACAYCADPETLVLMGDGRQKPLWMVEVGEEIYGTEVRGNYRRYVKTTVLASWNTRKRAYRTTLADGTELITSGDHRLLTERGWKHVQGTMSGAHQRPYLTPNNKLMGFGLNGLTNIQHAQFNADYRRGYLTGMIRGDGMLFRKDYRRANGGVNHLSSFRLALADVEALNRSRVYLEAEGIRTTTRPFAVASATRRPMQAIHTAKRAHYDRISELIRWPAQRSDDWNAGYLAGIFDAEGSCSRGVLRISNKAADVLEQIQSAMTALGIDHVLEPAHPNGVRNVRVSGGLPMRTRFFTLVGPAITRKLDIEGAAVKSEAKLQIVSIEDLGETIDMMDITTGTGDFIANGVISHNCFARPTHTYLDLDAGKDFDNEIIVKVNVAEVLQRELAKPSWGRHPVALGTNTDPYQRAEGRYALMPGIIDALADSGTPFSILTKGSLLRRDLDRIADAATRVPVDLAMSIAIYDDELQHSIEPGTPSTSARLATVTAVREHGLNCSVFLMPIIPYLTDSKAHLDEALRRIEEAGATSVLYTAMHLRPGVKEWFMLWLEREHPELVARYSEMYGAGAYPPKEYRAWLSARIRPLIARHGLTRGQEDPVTGGVRTVRAGRPRFTAPVPDSAGTLEIAPTLF
ncbi:intein-containing Rv2578c family radical SAM protein [Leifsonia sp. Root112D2]|uniref:intein-containing Rv2578c family radical SAM protein n=1 Tax=Leifsonia sp. Root112D2 TaxID=1736426 RepID=UPI0006FE8631|nr:intein-containing Rv2578c family radical SAM protein [Leifsonia sp. Root112D2]KQV06143.1 radical SAM protein [Leifsonia sp. Root112D2]